MRSDPKHSVAIARKRREGRRKAGRHCVVAKIGDLCFVSDKNRWHLR